jgi:D-proline reductase (dithiol) PrdB
MSPPAWPRTGPTQCSSPRPEGSATRPCLVQRAIEARGIPTIGITLQKEITRKVRPPRALYLRYPFGHPMGEAFNRAQQPTIVLTALEALATIPEPGVVLEPGWAWRRHLFT